MGPNRLLKSQEQDFAQLLVRARDGSDEALGTLLQSCRRYLLAYANRTLDSTLRPKGGASDLVQEAFILAQRDFLSFDGSTLGELLAWLHRIVEHQLHNQVRYYKGTLKRSVGRETSLDAGEPIILADCGASPFEEMAQEDEQRRLRIAVERLPDDYRRVLVLRTWQRLPLAEVAQRMGRSANAAGKLWIRAVERLEAELRTVE
jgi:RNA polymerase sigma-70 factor (ECF subfamily)